MPHGKSNWTFKDVESFLRNKGFVLHHVRGSHHFYRGMQGGVVRIVTVQYHGSNTIHPKTIGSIIKQSGISEDNWLAR